MQDGPRRGPGGGPNLALLNVEVSISFTREQAVENLQNLRFHVNNPPRTNCAIFTAAPQQPEKSGDFPGIRPSMHHRRPRASAGASCGFEPLRPLLVA